MSMPRHYVFGAGALCCLCILIFWMAFGVLKQRQAAVERIDRLQKQAVSIAEKASMLKQLQGARLPIHTGDGTLFSEVNSIVERLGVKKSIGSLTPSQMEENGMKYERVSIIATGMHQQNGVALIYALEVSSRNILVERIAIRRTHEELWNMALTVRRPQKGQ